MNNEQLMVGETSSVAVKLNVIMEDLEIALSEGKFKVIDGGVVSGTAMPHANANEGKCVEATLVLSADPPSLSVQLFAVALYIFAHRSFAISLMKTNALLLSGKEYERTLFSSSRRGVGVKDCAVLQVLLLLL